MRSIRVRLGLFALVPFALLSMCAPAANDSSDPGALDAGGGRDAADAHQATNGSDGGASAADAGANDGSSPPPDDASQPSADGATSVDAGPRFAGVTTRTFVDATRPTPANGTEPAHTSRTLVTEIWYPTLTSSPLATTVRDAPLAPGGPYPLVLFVHGSSSSRTLATYLTIALAQAGYVVAAADFPLTALSTPGGPSDLGVSAEVGDLSFLCDQLKAASADTSDALKGAVTGLAYAVAGHSTGGAVAELAAFAGDDPLITHDPRVRAGIALSGDACMFDPSFFKSRTVPFMAIGGTNDLFVRLANSGKWVFDNTNAPHVLAALVGGQHMGFTDIDLPDAILNPVPTGPTSDLAVTLRRYGDAGACLPVPPPGTDTALPAATQHALVVQLASAFLDAQLRNNPASLTALEAATNPMMVIQH